MRLLAVVADRLDRATFHSLGALGDLLVSGGLLGNVGVTTFIASREKRGSRFTTEITIDALLIDVKFTGDVNGPLFSFVCHRFNYGSGNFIALSSWHPISSVFLGSLLHWA